MKGFQQITIQKKIQKRSAITKKAVQRIVKGKHISFQKGGVNYGRR